MSRTTTLTLAILFACTTLAAQAPKSSDKPATPETCAKGAICIFGEAFSGKPYRHQLNSTMEFVLEVIPDFQGWHIAAVPNQPEGDCTEFASVANPPYRSHNALFIDTSYGWTAEQEIAYSPREFQFVTNCKDLAIETHRLDLTLWPSGGTGKEVQEAEAKLGTSPMAKGRFWITDSRIGHSSDTPDNKLGTIEWIKFAVEIKLPR